MGVEQSFDHTFEHLNLLVLVLLVPGTAPVVPPMDWTSTPGGPGKEDHMQEKKLSWNRLLARIYDTSCSRKCSSLCTTTTNGVQLTGIDGHREGSGGGGGGSPAPWEKSPLRKKRPHL